MGLLYNAMSLFAWYSSNLFFRDIALINEENVPKDGPTIVYGNHNNQFVDGVVNLKLFSYFLTKSKGLYIFSLQVSPCADHSLAVCSKLLRPFQSRDLKTLESRQDQEL